MRSAALLPRTHLLPHRRTAVRGYGYRTRAHAVHVYHTYAADWLLRGCYTWLVHDHRLRYALPGWLRSGWLLRLRVTLPVLPAFGFSSHAVTGSRLPRAVYPLLYALVYALPFTRSLYRLVATRHLAFTRLDSPHTALPCYYTRRVLVHSFGFYYTLPRFTCHVLCCRSACRSCHGSTAAVGSCTGSAARLVIAHSLRYTVVPYCPYVYGCCLPYHSSRLDFTPTVTAVGCTYTHLPGLHTPLPHTCCLLRSYLLPPVGYTHAFTATGYAVWVVTVTFVLRYTPCGCYVIHTFVATARVTRLRIYTHYTVLRLDYARAIAFIIRFHHTLPVTVLTPFAFATFVTRSRSTTVAVLTVTHTLRF